VNANYANKKYIRLNNTTVSGLQDKVVEFKVTLTNFLGISGSSTVIVTFITTKKIIIDGLFSTYFMIDNVDNKLFLSASLPYCPADDRQVILNTEKNLTID